MRALVCQESETFPDGETHLFLPMRVMVDGVVGPKNYYRLSNSDRFEEYITRLIEGPFTAPYINEAERNRTVQFIVQRGLDLSLANFTHVGFDIDLLSPMACIELVGGRALFSQVWEAMRFRTGALPWSVQFPMVRVVQGSVAYSHQITKYTNAQVLVIAARIHSFSDTPPRYVSEPLYALSKKLPGLEVCVPSPAYPNVVLDALRVVTQQANSGRIIHMDCHGALLTYEQFVDEYGEKRRIFEEQSWGRQVMPYVGSKGFILLETSTDGGLPVSGDEFAVLCRDAGIGAVVLNACEAGSSKASNSFALDLIEGGVPQVVAMRHKVSTEAAAILVGAFYTALTTHGCVARAACAARRALYDRRKRLIGEDFIAVDDWLSLVHYCVEIVRPFVEVPAAESIEITQACTLPTPFEWKIHQLQKVDFRQQMDRQQPNADEPFVGRVLVITGAVGLGAETVVAETTRWMEHTSPRIRGTLRLDFSHGVLAAIEKCPILDPDVETWDDWIVAIKSQIGPKGILVFENVDLGRDNGWIGESDFSILKDFASILINSGVTCIAPMSQPLAFSPSLPGHDCFAVAIFPLTYAECQEHLVRRQPPNTDAQTKALLQLCIWVSAGFGDIVLALDPTLTKPQLEQFLDYFVSDGPPPELVLKTLAVPLKRTHSRYAKTMDKCRADVLIPCLAGLGAGISIYDIQNFGKNIEGGFFPGIAKINVKKTLHWLEQLYINGLATTLDRDTLPPNWLVHDRMPQALLCNPFLRPIVRSRLSVRKRNAIDHWTVAFAIDKMNYFSRCYFDEQYDNSEIRPFIYHAWPLFSTAIWLVRKYKLAPQDLLDAVGRGKIAGWWPHDIDLSVLVDKPPAKLDLDSAYSEASRLLIEAEDLQLRWQLEEAREMLERALRLAAAPHEAPLRTQLLERLGTVALDHRDWTRAGQLLSRAELSCLRNGPGKLMPWITYDQACLLRNVGRESDATLRFKQAVDGARSYGLTRIESLCFQELAFLELGTELVIGAELPSSIDESDELRVAQAALYIRRAAAAAKRGNHTEDRPALFFLRAFLALVRHRKNVARFFAQKALALYEKSGDGRATHVRNFLDQIGR